MRRAIVHGKMAPPKMTAWGPAAYTGKGTPRTRSRPQSSPTWRAWTWPRWTSRWQWIDGANDVESRVRVTVSTTWTPIMLALFGGQKTLSASSTMPIAH